MTGKSTNLHITRFLAAVLVIFSHSFALTQGNGDQEWLWILTGGQLDMGALAVSVFFLCGGYLTARSMNRYTGFCRYLLLRLGRIIPSLMFVVVCSVLTGGVISTLSAKDYFTDSMTFRYLLNGFMILQHDLPGVFEEAKYASTVNGALWTLPVEFICNIGCFVAMKLGLLEKKTFKFTFPIVVTGCILVYIAGSRISVIRAVIRPCLLFYVGMIYWIYREKIVPDIRIAWLSLALLPVCSIFRVLNPGMILFFPYAMMTFWFGSRQHFEKASKLGDYSYAMYLWGFPVQQFVCERSGWEMSPYLNSLISIPVAFILAVLTYHMIEVPVGNAWKTLVKGKLVDR